MSDKDIILKKLKEEKEEEENKKKQEKENKKKQEEEEILFISSSCECSGYFSYYNMNFINNIIKKEYNYNKFLENLKESSKIYGCYPISCIIRSIKKINKIK